MQMPTRREDVLVSTEWLAGRLDAPRVRPVDCRYYFEGRTGQDEYRQGHIPGAVYLSWADELSDHSQPVDYMMPTAAQVSAVFGRLGIGDDDLIVAYDDEGGHYASRVWLILARWGVADRIRLLDGGWVKWTAEGRAVTTDEPAPRSATFTIDAAAGHPEIIASADDVLSASRSGAATILDVRRMSEFTGEEVRAERGGRIPGARHLFWQDNLHWDAGRDFVSPAEIRARHEAKGVTPETPVITYCQGAVRAAHAALALWMSGYRDVRVYDGSWAEWGNRDDLPIESGPPSDE